MNNSSFYDLTTVPFSDRETFNNAILLLSMVKSEAYYIVGFSRLDKKIEIGFDFKSSFNSTITQLFTMSLNIPDRIHFKAILIVNGQFLCENIIKKYEQNFFIENNNIAYEKSIERDLIIPVSVEDIDKAITYVKKDIINFINDYFKNIEK